MTTRDLFDPNRRSKAPIALAICLAVLVVAELVAWLVQTDFFKVRIANVNYANEGGIRVRAKLLRPREATAEQPLPGIVAVHGYQNNRETSDPYCVELARRGFVVLCIDAIGRGNSGVPGDEDDPRFDTTYGVRASLAYLKSLPFVDVDSVGLVGHSLGAEMAYRVALDDPTVKALVISGFAYTDEATTSNPNNMLMIIGIYDEYRQRMTGVRDIARDWMGTPQTKKVFPVPDPRLDVSYGDFSEGTARRVFLAPTIHIGESHTSLPIAAAVVWMKNALNPPEALWIPPYRQTWHIKEWATLLAMVAGLASLLPLGLFLLRLPFFRSLQGPAQGAYACSWRDWARYAAVNGLLEWLYLPLVLVLFAVHLYLVPIDKAFPMMMVNGIVWWFLVTNLAGLLLFWRWYRRQSRQNLLTLADLGISFRESKLALDAAQLGKTALLAAILFLYVYWLEAGLEALLLVDWRFIFPFASDLTPYRALLALEYFPFLLIGFLCQGMFLHGQIRLKQFRSWPATWAYWTAGNVAALVVPLLLFLAVQYVPLLTVGLIPFTGPGGVLANFTMGLFHIVGVLILVVPISTWFFQLTGKIYLGALLDAAVVAWMFTSSQVIAPIPV